MFKLTTSILRLGSLNTTLAFRFALPKHQVLSMPALSPTMTEGKILKWLKKAGDKVEAGDAIAEIETDKATMTFEVQEKGYIAKTTTNDGFIQLGAPVVVIAKKADEVAQFKDYDFDKAATPAPKASPSPAATSTPTPAASEAPTQPQQPKATQEQPSQPKSSSERVIASPLAKSIANTKGIDLSSITGSGPSGRILKQDVEGYTPQVKVEAKQEQQAKKAKPPAKKGFVVPENPYQDISLSSMRKTIANRLSESKQTIPHYYITSSIEMGATNVLRNELNKNEKENGVKISINDIIIKAMALALRDYPNVNVQWLNNSIRKFKHSDVSVAVAIEGGLVTPIVFRAETLGLLDIARRTKDIAKRAREGKLDPSEYVGGTSTVSNLGMFGVNTVTSIINPPQASILGIGKTEKRLLVAAEGSNLPYRVAEVMDIIASVDHRAVDGALAAQWLGRIKHYLQSPTHMLL